MLKDDEKNVSYSLRISLEPDDAANNTSQTESAPCKIRETGVEVTEEASRSKDEGKCAMPITENLTFVSEEEKSKRSEKQDILDVEKDNGAKASKSSWRVMFHKKENASILSSQLNSNRYNAANDIQSENIKVTDNTFTVNLMFGSEKLTTQESEMEDKNKFEQIFPDEVRNRETNGSGKEDEMEGDDQQKEESEIEEGKLEQDNVDGGNEQARVSDQMGEESKEDSITTEKQVLGETAGPSSQKRKGLKKTERTGMIFMCNRRTKQDCFDYKVFGLPANMRNIVRKVTKGTRLFLFDIDLRVMYGIYRAAAPGDYNIEPNAFKSAFPSQVRFTVVEDCTPLPEENFRMAIKDNYYRQNMFNCQLTSEQVKKLSKLFVAASGGPNVNLKNYVKQENLIDEEMDEENANVRNTGKAAVEEDGETAIEEEKKNEEDLVVEDKSNELICIKADSGDEEVPSSSEEESTSEGMIFLCSSKTKQDCLHYKVLGLPANMRTIVQKVYKGMKLFMFDVDFRVMYGIFKAAEPGGYNIEPKAFNSAFPSQVRFTVVEDCTPLPEEKIRGAIIDNYYWKNKFNCQLTSEQVNKLSKLFIAASRGPALSLKDNVANNSQSNATMSNPVDMNFEGICVKKENPIEEEEKQEVGPNSEEKNRKKRKRGKEKNLMQRDGKKGMIFMCNSKTKQDCLHYKVLGLPANMREIVQKVQKGMRLFMFDVDLRVMYGIYKAAGPGGYNIEPKAFNSGFPSQVRFTVLEDCLPLGEEEFRAVIKDNYYTKWKFTGELSSEQVKSLCKLFSSASEGRDRIRQHNLDRQYRDSRITYGGDSYVRRVLVPMAQLPPLAYTPKDVSHVKVNISRGGPLLRSHGQRGVRSRQLRNLGPAARSRDRKKMLYVKEIEMKSRYFEGECRRLEMLLQCSAEENQALRASLQNAMSFEDFHDQTRVC